MPSYEEALPALRDAARSLRKAQAVGLYMDGLFEEAHLRNRIKNKQGRRRSNSGKRAFAKIGNIRPACLYI